MLLFLAASGLVLLTAGLISRLRPAIFVAAAGLIFGVSVSFFGIDNFATTQRQIVYSDDFPAQLPTHEGYATFVIRRDPASARVAIQIAYSGRSLNSHVGPVAFGLGFLLMVGYGGILSAFARRWPLSETAQRRMQLFLAESIDIRRGPHLRVSMPLDSHKHAVK